MKTYWGSEGICTRWRWVGTFTPRPLYPGERAPGTCPIEDWVEIRTEILQLISENTMTVPQTSPRFNPAKSHSKNLSCLFIKNYQNLILFMT